jgi:hypothetical protein
MLSYFKKYLYICKKGDMKRLVFILAIIPFITSCLKYSEPKSLSLSGEYVIDKITYQETDGDPSPQDSTYLTGSVYYDDTDIPSLDTIIVGDTKLHMDYSIIRFDPTQNQFGGTNWNTEYFYFVHGQRTAYDLGNIVFDCEGTRRIWKILDDSNESLTVRTSGQWVDGTRKSVVLSLTRIGP